MPIAIDCVLIDCVDLEAMTAFWCGLLTSSMYGPGPPVDICSLQGTGSGRRLGLMPAHVEKTSKNRVHFDLRSDDDQQAEVRRLEGLGARLIEIGQVGVTWVVMADPEGNEFCVLRSLAEKEKDRSRLGDWWRM